MTPVTYFVERFDSSYGGWRKVETSFFDTRPFQTMDRNEAVAAAVQAAGATRETRVVDQHGEPVGFSVRWPARRTPR